MYSTHSERKTIFAERFIRTLKKKIIKWFVSWINKKDIVIYSLFPEPNTSSKMRIKVGLDLTNSATKSDLENAKKCWYIKNC